MGPRGPAEDVSFPYPTEVEYTVGATDSTGPEVKAVAAAVLDSSPIVTVTVFDEVTVRVGVSHVSDVGSSTSLELTGTGLTTKVEYAVGPTAPVPVPVGPTVVLLP